MGKARGRPIELYAYPITVPGPFGLWFRLPHRDAIFFQRESVSWHQDHIILHELGHLLCDHPSDIGVLDPATIAIRSNPPAGLEWGADGDIGGPGGEIRRRRRVCYGNHYEREAELCATIIQEWGSVLRADPIPLGDPAEQRISQSLTYHQGWR
jgi:hypothetical protein